MFSAGCLLISWFFYQQELRNPPPMLKERIYYTHYGGIYCARHEMTPCGVRLSNCADTNIYECLHEIHYEE